jgi:DNA-binding PadR family transcriptional regulator
MMVVSLLSASPKNGVEIMDGIEALTRGWWRPSPGSVYPLLERMNEEGTVHKRDDGRYELTAKANAELEVSFGTITRRPRTGEEAIAESQNLVSYLEDLAKMDQTQFRDISDRAKALAKKLEQLGC